MRPLSAGILITVMSAKNEFEFWLWSVRGLGVASGRIFSFSVNLRRRHYNSDDELVGCRRCWTTARLTCEPTFASIWIGLSSTSTRHFAWPVTAAFARLPSTSPSVTGLPATCYFTRERASTRCVSWCLVRSRWFRMKRSSLYSVGVTWLPENIILL